MNTHDTDIAAKIAARDLITALHGLSIQCATEIMGLVELSVINGNVFHPEHIERYRAPVKGLPQGAALNAVRLARHIILAHTEVDMNSEAASLAFNLWSKEAALAGARMAA